MKNYRELCTQKNFIILSYIAIYKRWRTINKINNNNNKNLLLFFQKSWLVKLHE